ncbi:carboxyl transferase domain-containing protein [Piscicoccus intestinalis]|uniref:carboxyl transferase domain-containing protein n=1 Tax=Piscicoccus intestinalis TaxID=746033 RepID=UPI0008384353|nr:carboxyl transferase domain-containing protein [Piscicoccus intestinalis]
MSRRHTSRALIELVLDDGSFESWDAPVDTSEFAPEYQTALAKAAQRAGTDEAVVTGSGTIDGLPVAVIVGEFAFLGGSIGVRTAQRITAAVRRATAQRLPLIAATSSGGTRMQEGTPAFVEMVTISRAIVQHKAAGLPYLVYLRHPTTGGVFASWGSLGHVTVAEPGALVGFLGPKVYEALNGEPFPAGVQLAENLVDKGVIDAVVPDEHLAPLAARVMRLLHPSGPHRGPARPVLSGVADPAAVPDRVRGAVESTHAMAQDEPPRAGSPRADSPHEQDPHVWESVLLTRSDRRPGVRELLRYAADDVIPLSGTGEGQHDAGLVLALTSFGGLPCVLVGQDRRNQARQSMGPAALRGARRGMRLAQELGLPLVSVIDTPGADLSTGAEEGALAGEIARSIAELSTLTVPSVALLIGQGCGGGALAMLPARSVVAAEHAWLSPLPPEGASVIVHGTVDQAPEMARAQGVGARDLLAHGIVHHVVPERPAAHENPRLFCRHMAAAAVAELRRQLRD